MVFTNAERVAIRQYLGYPGVLLDHNSRLESAMDVIGADTDQAAAVRAIMASVVSTDTNITNAQTKAGLKRAEDIEWYQQGSGGGQIDTLRSEGRKFCSRLSQIFGVGIANDYFGDSGYRGDGWASAGNQYGGPIPLG
jgi:hypothetical protein